MNLPQSGKERGIDLLARVAIITEPHIDKHVQLHYPTHEVLVHYQILEPVILVLLKKHLFFHQLIYWLVRNADYRQFQ